jgi:hypothetical protein
MAIAARRAMIAAIALVLGENPEGFNPRLSASNLLRQR